MNSLYDGGLMRCCVQDFVRQIPRTFEFGDTSIITSCCNQYIERRPDGDWEWVGAERQREMEKQT